MRALDFFAGSGLVRIGLEPEFTTVWANDISAKKAAVYDANAPAEPLCLSSIDAIHGADLPAADLAWASFPCQDLSLAGTMTGMGKGTRSGLFWDWVRVLDELAEVGRRPSVLVAENVVGFLTAHRGADFKRAYDALKARGCRLGAVVVDARLFVPQSRPRAFLIAAAADLPLHDLAQSAPEPAFHSETLVRVARDVIKDPNWVWWSLPSPSAGVAAFADLCERDAPCDQQAKTRELRALLSPLHRRKLDHALGAREILIGAGYRRTREDGRGRKVQRLELRFDGIAGCLRTPEGGSSRQVVVIVNKGKVKTRLMTVRECARLMGAPDTYVIPGSYNDGYRAMGDAVAVPVVRWLTRHLLAPLASRAGSRRTSAGHAA